MSLVHPTQPAAVLVAIDIAKLRHDVLIEAPGWKRRKRLRMDRRCCFSYRCELGGTDPTFLRRCKSLNSSCLSASAIRSKTNSAARLA